MKRTAISRKQPMRKLGVERVCPCGKVFAGSKSGTYCSRTCLDRYKRRWVEGKGVRCAVCRSTHGLQRHHVVYEQHVRAANGDVYDQRNGLTLCHKCHSGHHQGNHRLTASLLTVENREFAYELLGEAAADYVSRYYGD